MQPMNQTQTRANPDRDLYPIRTVSSLTGVNSITLRAWERRYGLVQPQRTPKGHRLYTQQDIDLIHRVLELLDKGIPIGQVKRALQDESLSSDAAEAPGPWGTYQRRMINAIVRFDEYALDETYNEALSLYPVDLVTRELIIPLLKTLGERWEHAEGSVAEEHLFGSYLRNKLGARFHHRIQRNRGPKIIAACVPGEYHEVGLLLFCLHALDQDFQIVLLGANLPFAELPVVVERSAAEAIILSGSITPAPHEFQQNLTQLTQAVDIPVLVGGGTSIKLRDHIVRAGAIPVGTDHGQALRQLSDLLNKSTQGTSD